MNRRRLLCLPFAGLFTRKAAAKPESSPRGIEALNRILNDIAETPPLLAPGEFVIPDVRAFNYSGIEPDRDYGGYFQNTDFTSPDCGPHGDPAPGPFLAS